MTAAGVDYAGRHPTPAQLKAAGKTFACRYFGAGGAWKHADKAECDALRAAGIAIVTNVEDAADGLLGGYAVGRSWAAQAEGASRIAGAPAGRPIYLSVDFPADASHWSRIDAALVGAASVIGAARVGVYGSYATVEHCNAMGSARWFWQTYAWSHGAFAPFAHLYQYRNGQTLGSGVVDLVTGYGPDFGQWGAQAPPALRPGQRTYTFIGIDGRWPVLRRGDNDAAQGGTKYVKRAQQLLGMAIIDQDGIYGAMTAARVKALDLGGMAASSRDGSVIGGNEWRKLLGAW